MATVTGSSNIWKHAGLHMQAKLKYFSPKMAEAFKYILSKLRKYSGSSEFFESLSTIEANTGISRRTIQGAIRRAEQLGILEVSERFESTLNGHMRQTSNCIRLLEFTEFELITEIKEVVRQVKSAIRTVVEKAKDTIKKTPKQSKPQPRQTPAKQYSRQEIVPEWISKPQTSTTDISPDQQRRFSSLQDRLKNKYRKRGDTNGSRN